MDIFQAMRERHSVRSYLDKPIAPGIIKQLNDEIDRINSEAELHFQLVTNEPKAFDGFMAHYGKFSGVKNYIAVIGKKTADFEEKCGYYGERLVLFAQQLGLNTCWVALTYSKIKNAYEIKNGEKLLCVISIGYGVNQGKEHKSKTYSEVTDAGENTPAWYKNGIDCALLAPTAINQQKFFFSLEANNKVIFKALHGPYSVLDLGIVKYHFEVGANGTKFNWG